MKGGFLLYQKEGVFQFEKARSKATGEPTEREGRRKGSYLSIMHLAIGQPMFLEYEKGGVLKTSLVKMIKESKENLEVVTMNTVYTFRKMG